MTKKKTTPSQQSPKWKSSQSASRKRSKKPRGNKKRASGVLPVRFIRALIMFSLLGVVARYVGLPVFEKVTAHPVFNVREVNVEGAEYLDSQDIYVLADVEKGRNIFDIDMKKISDTLTGKYTTEKFTVYRRLPHTVVIEIHERKPVALLNMKELVGVDSDGVPLPHIGADMIESLPIITGIKSIAALTDTTTKDRLVSGLRMLEKISKDAPSVYSRISEVDVSITSSLGFSLIDNGLQVILGDSDWKKNIPRLERVINEVLWRKEDVKSVDIRFEDKVIVTK
ncbi:cell division protein FtsQ/DivIB [Candidatus Latescibacterota bacterium]